MGRPAVEWKRRKDGPPITLHDLETIISQSRELEIKPDSVVRVNINWRGEPTHIYFVEPKSDSGS